MSPVLSLRIGAGLAAFALTGALCGCRTLETVSDVGTQIAVSQGAITEEEADSIRRSTVALSQSFEQFTPEQEYYVGRAVAATILQQYEPLDRQPVDQYLNQVGQALALACDRPETFGGYHFLALESDEINAFAAPGGLILVSRGMLRLCETEDELAAVLAHEIGHVVKQHGLAAIKNSRVIDALTVLAAEGARNFGDEQLEELTEVFEGSVTDVTSTLMTSGYARGLEREADFQAMTVLRRVGYDPEALVRVLRRMEQSLAPGGRGFASTHPPPASRVRDIRPAIASMAAPAPSTTERALRFSRAMQAI